MSDRQHHAASNGTCPALTLPVEITSEIFLRCVSTTGPASPLNNPPILLTKICRDWRLIVLSMPKLWNDIRLPEFRGKRGPRPGYIDSWWVSQLGTWLSRAKDEPLTMSIIANMNHPDPDESLVGLLDGHRQRWHDLTLKLPFNRFYQFLSQEPLPMLERLVVDAHSIPRAVDTPIAAFQLAPMLKHVCLSGYFRPSHFILPWGQLTSLELTAARAEDCLECLRRAPHLLTCSFEIQEGQQSLRPVASRPRLTALTTSGTSPSAIFMYITLPGLEELNFAGRSLNGEDLSQISSLVSRSRCQLRRLGLHFISELLTAPAIQLLEALPSLENLDLAATEASTIMTLFASLCSESFLPQLQHLSLSHHRMADSNIHEMFYDMAKVLARRGLLTPEHVQLQSFSLTVQYEETAPNLRVIQKLQTLADRGMSLSVRNQHNRWI